MRSPAQGAPRLHWPQPRQPQPQRLADGRMQVFFGDLHLHTAYSMDAASVHTETLPDDAYRFAKGEAVQYFGRTVQRHAPGTFTTFVGFEYSPSFRGTTRGQMHRNVIFRGPQFPGMPFAATDSLHPEALWSYE